MDQPSFQDEKGRSIFFNLNLHSTEIRRNLFNDQWEGFRSDSKKLFPSVLETGAEAEETGVD